MKNIIIILLCFFSILPLFASVTFSDFSFDDNRFLIEDALEKAIGNRKDIDIKVSNILQNDDDISFNLTYGGKIVEFSSQVENMEEELNNLFFYEEELYEEGERLDYIYQKTFSSISLKNAKRGSLYSLVGSDKKAEALFYVHSIHDGAVLLRPVYLKEPKVGMSLKKESNIFYSFRLFSNLKFNDYGILLAANSAIFSYPLISSLGVVINPSSSNYLPYISFKGEFFLSSINPNLAFIRNIRVGGEFGLAFSFKNSFRLLGIYSLFLTTSLSESISIEIGLLNLDDMKSLMVGLGVRL